MAEEKENPSVITANKSNNKKLILIIAAIVGVVVLCGLCGLSIFIASKLTDDDNDSKIEDSSDSNDSNNDDNSNEDSDDFSQEDYEDCKTGCKMLSSGDEEDACIEICEAAKNLDSDNIEDCDKLDPLLQYSCVSDKAVDQKDPDLCERINDSLYRDICYSTAAEELDDEDICDRIETSYMVDSCKETVNNN